MKKFDIIIGGAGLSGLTLAYYLNNSSLRQKNIGIIDIDPFNKKDNYISFWTKETYFFDSLVKKSWNEIQIFFNDYKKKYFLHSYSYKHLSALSYKQYIINQLSKNPHITFIKDKLIDYSLQNSSVIISTKKEYFQTDLLFDSTHKPLQLQSFERLLYMQSLTQEIRIKDSTINPRTMTFLDFRTNDGSFFCYCLPVTNNHAVFQLTTISKCSEINKKDMQNKLEIYLSQIQKISSFTIINEQFGVIPLTDKTFKRNINQCVINIGLNGGQVKPSTGFGFTRILEDSKAIVHSLEQYNKLSFKHNPTYYALFDSIFLEIISTEPKRMEQIFKEMFQSSKNLEHIFKFLNEKSSLIEIIMLFKNVNYYPYLKALLSKNMYHKFVH